MDVYNFLFLYVESTEDCEIWDIEKEKTVFKGSIKDACNSDFIEYDVQSFGIENGIIVVNI